MSELKGKKPERYIRYFTDLSGTINGFVDSATPDPKFPESIKKLEQALNAKALLTVLTGSEYTEAHEAMTVLQTEFAKYGMRDRIDAVRYVTGRIDKNGEDETLEVRTRKNNMVNDIATDLGEDGTAFCVYAGDTRDDAEMINDHVAGRYFKNVPCAFIDATGVSACAGGSHIFNNGAKTQIPHAEKMPNGKIQSNVRALIAANDFIAENVNQIMRCSSCDTQSARPQSCL